MMFLTEEQQKSIICEDGTTVQLIDVMANDSEISQCARTSYGKNQEVRTARQDSELLHYMMRHSHSSPFETGQIRFLLYLPIDTNRQHIRHRMSSTSEYSTRYSEAIDEMATVGGRMWRTQSTTNRQGSGSGFVDSWPENWVFQRTQDGSKQCKDVSDLDMDITARRADELGVKWWDAGPWRKDWELWNLSAQATGGQAELVCEGLPEGLTPGDYLSMRESDVQETCKLTYEERLLFGVAREVARKDLPMSNFTRLYWSIDLHNLMHYFGLRCESHAQLEIRQMACAMRELVRPWFPITLGAFDEWKFNSVKWGELEWKALKAGVRGEVDPCNVVTYYATLWAEKYGMPATGRQLAEFKAKASDLHPEM